MCVYVTYDVCVVCLYFIKVDHVPPKTANIFIPARLHGSENTANSVYITQLNMNDELHTVMVCIVVVPVNMCMPQNMTYS